MILPQVFYSLKKENGLLNELIPKEGNVLIRQEINYETLTDFEKSNFYKENPDSKILKFMLFKSYYQFYLFLISTPVQQRSFHEYIGLFPFKPFFDIDVCEPLLDSCEVAFEVTINIILSIESFFKNVLNKDFQIEKEILLFSSNSKNKNKGSYHIILKNYRVTDFNECKDFAHKITSQIDDKYLKFIDFSCYSSLKSIRTFKSIKDDRIKEIVPKILINSKLLKFKFRNFIKDRDLGIFYDSLISNTFQTKKLDFGYIPSIKKEFNYSLLEDLQIIQIMKIVNEVYPQCFEIMSYDSIILLKNISGYFCKTCKRNHDNQNPFITLLGTTVIFHCRQNQKCNEILGYIEESEKKTSNETEIEFIEESSTEILDFSLSESPKESRKESPKESPNNNLGFSFEKSLNAIFKEEILNEEKQNEVIKEIPIKTSVKFTILDPKKISDNIINNSYKITISCKNNKLLNSNFKFKPSIIKND